MFASGSTIRQEIIASEGSTFGDIDPNEIMIVWFNHLDDTLQFNEISEVSIQKTEVLFFEHHMLIIHVSTKKKTK
jgi:hypothetical protein